jgi:hypothetical protein
MPQIICTLPKNGSPGLLPAAIVTSYACRRQVAFVTKVLQKSDFSDDNRAGGAWTGW